MGCVSLYKDVDCSLITSTPYEGVLSLSLYVYIYNPPVSLPGEVVLNIL